MKTVLKISILLNLLLAVGLLFALIADLRREKNLPSSAPSPKLTAAAMANSHAPVASETPAAQFRWQQLDSGNDYRRFIANLRAIGCPENTLRDIVRGNVGRAFSWQRARLKIDDSGNGPWSKASEIQLVNNLLGESSPAEAIVSSKGINNSAGQKGVVQTASAEQNIGDMIQPDGSNEVAEISNQSQGNQSPGQPFLTQNGNWGANPSQMANASPPLNGMNSQNPNANTPASDPANSSPKNTSTPDPSQSSPSDPPKSVSTTPSTPSGPPDPLGPDDPYAVSGPDQQLNGLNKYDNWFEPQAMDNSDDGNLNVDLFSAPQ